VANADRHVLRLVNQPGVDLALLRKTRHRFCGAQKNSKIIFKWKPTQSIF
jgi:hypothetical protein